MAIIIVFAIITWGVGLLLIPFIEHLYYQIKKSGVVFWIREGVPIYIFADRHNLTNAQEVATLIVSAKESNKTVSL